MRKKITTLSLVLLSLGAYAQTIVSTTPENKNVILEEYTGIQCVFCPQGHAIAQGIQDNNPGDAYLINVHVGGFAVPGAGQPDFRTPFGAALDDQAIVPGYPAGSVNRHFFPGMTMGGGTAMGRQNWVAASNQVLGENSYVNVGVEAVIDVQTNEISVHVEGYYTGNSPESTNLLNVALLQNNTLGPQVGGGAGNEYVHMHRLVYFLTGQWGETIPTTTTGTFVDETFTYTIPADYNDVPVELADLEIVAFITETHQEIISGSGCFPTYTGITNANDANVESIEEIAATCTAAVSPKVNIQNLGQDPLTSLDIEYSINSGTTETYTWTGNLTSLQSETIELPEIAFVMDVSNTVNVSVPSDDDNTNNTGSIVFDQAIGGTGSVDMVLHTDGYGSECTWNIKDSSGAVLYSGGPYGNNQTINESFALPEDCITFNLIDSYGDGGGSVTLTDSDGTQLFYTNGTYGSGVSSEFSSNGVLGIEGNELQAVVIYPNPASTELYVKNAEGASISVYDILGKQILAQNDISLNQEIEVSRLQAGTYFIKITTENGVKTDKFIIAR